MNSYFDLQGKSHSRENSEFSFSRGTSRSSSGRRILDDFDDMDIEFDSPPAQDQGEDLDDFEEDPGNSQDTDTSNQQHGGELECQGSIYLGILCVLFLACHKCLLSVCLSST